jgi:cytochrome b subunit of formate dehydrogenase
MAMSARRAVAPLGATCLLVLPLALAGLVHGQTNGDEYEPIDSDACATCHDDDGDGASVDEHLSHSVHRGFECLDCHVDKGTVPHREPEEGFAVGCQGCRTCHIEASEAYQAHGRAEIGTCEDIPQCKDCHGEHEILPSSVKLSRTHPVNLPTTCGRCHENLNLTTKYDILIDRPIELYESSVHGRASKGGVYVAATCNDCHSTGGTAHKILAPGHADSSINHFNIPRTCGECHKGVENDFWEGIHGMLAERGEVDAPVCTHCHGEHGILSPDDPRSPVARSKVAEMTCSPCHESAVLNEKYGLRSGRLTSFIDSYHGLKSKAGDTHVANCASCHGVHRILPSRDPTSTIHPANLQDTCGECHPGISEAVASRPIHGITGEGLQTTAADIVERIYIVAIVVIIGLMVLHWALDLVKQIRRLLARKPQILRMTLSEVWQHTFLMVTFIVLVVSGFALRFSESWLSRFFFGWEGGFERRGEIHRFAAVVFIFTVVWHAIYVVASRRGRKFYRDIFPGWIDFSQFWHRIEYNLGRRARPPRYGRFSYVEKAEYWALIWGSVVMVITGLMLWFDNWFIRFFPKGVLDVALVIHYWEAWLATLAIFVWHLYSTVFDPRVYPMNPSWLTGRMPDAMYRHEHPEHFEEAREETEEQARRELERLKARSGDEGEEEDYDRRWDDEEDDSAGKPGG